MRVERPGGARRGQAPGVSGRHDASGKRFAVLAGRFNDVVTEKLVEGARDCFVEHGAARADVEVVWVPGAWELPPVARRLAESGNFAGIVAIGCVIRGDTPHFEYVASAATDGLAAVALSAPVPVTFGLLTTENLAQALARAGGAEGNKGWDAALSALEMADLYRQLEGRGEGA